MAALGSQAMADEEPLTWNFCTTLYAQSYDGASYNGISFSLGTESDRYTATAPLYRDDFNTSLVSIQIADRNKNDSDIPSTLALMAVDSAGTMPGISDSHTKVNAKMNGFDFTRRISTFTFDTENTPVTLNSSETYYAYFVSAEKAEELKEAESFVLTTENFAATVSSASLFAYRGGP